MIRPGGKHRRSTRKQPYPPKTRTPWHQARQRMRTAFLPVVALILMSGMAILQSILVVAEAHGFETGSPATRGETTTFLNSACFILGVVFFVKFAEALYSLYLYTPGRRRLQELVAKKRPVEAQMASIEGNMTFFVAYSKLQREHNKIQAEIDECVKQLVQLGDESTSKITGKSSANNDGINGILDLVSKWTAFLSPKIWRKRAFSMLMQPMAAIVLTYWWWGQPLVVFPPSYFWPFGWIFSKPLFGSTIPSGALGALGWYIVCSRGCSRILKALRLT